MPHPGLGCGIFGGPDRIRTDDPHNANVMRSQLRYRPVTIELYPSSLRLSMDIGEFTYCSLRSNVIYYRKI